MKKLTVLIAFASLLAAGCANRFAVIANTSTVIGLDISENPASQLYHVKFGYARSEVAYVPSNKGADTNSPSYQGGAKDVADTIMELRYENMFKGGGLYQRLAVGSVAVAQPGAAMMLAKDGDGTLTPTSAAAVVATVNKVPATDANVTSALLPLTAAYKRSNQPGAFDAIAIKYGYTSFAAMAVDPAVSKATVDKITADLKQANLLP